MAGIQPASSIFLTFTKIGADMTTQEISTAVNTYLAAHLDSAYWAGLEAAKKTAASAMAADEILARLNMDADALDGASGAGQLVLKAIAEQALFLSRNYAAQASEKAGRVEASETIDGVSFSYAITGKGDSLTLSSRADMFLARARKALLANVRFARG